MRNSRADHQSQSDPFARGGHEQPTRRQSYEEGENEERAIFHKRSKERIMVHLGTEAQTDTASRGPTSPERNATSESARARERSLSMMCPPRSGVLRSARRKRESAIVSQLG